MLKGFPSLLQMIALPFWTKDNPVFCSFYRAVNEASYVLYQLAWFILYTKRDLLFGSFVLLW
jgi:hypothetical protein